MIFKLAFRNVIRNKRRNFLTTMMIITAVFLMIIFQGILNGSQASFIESTTKYESGDIKLFPPNSEDTLGLPSLLNTTDEILELLEELSYIKAYSSRIKMPSVIIYKDRIKGVQTVAINPCYEIYTTEIVNKIVNGSYLNGENNILLGLELANEFDLKINENVTLLLPNGVRYNFTIIGFYNTKIIDFDKRYIYVNLEIIQELLDLNENQTSEIMILLDDSTKVDDFANNINLTLNQNDIKCDVKTWKEMAQTLLQIVELNAQVMGLVYLIALIIAGMGIMNTTYMSISERTREIGILQAIGLKPSRILKSFLLEVLIIGVIGGIFGSIIGISLGIYLDYIGIEIPKEVQVFPFTKIRVIITPLDIISTFIFALIVCLFAGLIPSIKAARKEPMEALRYE